MNHLIHFVDSYLMSALRVIAHATASNLNVKFKSIKAMDPEDELYRSTLGYNDDGHIKIRLRNYKTNRYYSMAYLVETVVHEVIHQVYDRHGEKFNKLYEKCLREVRKELGDKAFFKQIMRAGGKEKDNGKKK